MFQKFWTPGDGVSLGLLLHPLGLPEEVQSLLLHSASQVLITRPGFLREGNEPLAIPQAEVLQREWYGKPALPPLCQNPPGFESLDPSHLSVVAQSAFEPQQILWAENRPHNVEFWKTYLLCHGVDEAHIEILFRPYSWGWRKEEGKLREGISPEGKKEPRNINNKGNKQNLRTKGAKAKGNSCCPEKGEPGCPLPNLDRILGLVQMPAPPGSQTPRSTGARYGVGIPQPGHSPSTLESLCSPLDPSGPPPFQAPQNRGALRPGILGCAKQASRRGERKKPTEWSS